MPYLGRHNIRSFLAEGHKACKAPPGGVRRVYYIKEKQGKGREKAWVPHNVLKHGLTNRYFTETASQCHYGL